MGAKPDEDLSRRERQVMDVVYRLGEATVAEVQRELAAPPSYSAVRTFLRILEEKGYLRHRESGPRYVYLPRVPRDKARRSALRRLLRNFFEDSSENLVAALLDAEASRLSPEELDNLAGLVERARKQGR
jgi:BlaI family transcriptional regulator, penicillinase repressor